MILSHMSIAYNILTEVMLGYNKNYVTLVLNQVLNNSKGTLSVSEINRRYRNNNMETN